MQRLNISILLIQSLVLSLIFDCSLPTFSMADELRVPAFTAYMLPNPESARISEQKGVTLWNDPTQSVNWYGKFETTGELKLKSELCLADGTSAKFRMTVDEESREATATGSGSGSFVTAIGTDLPPKCQ